MSEKIINLNISTNAFLKTTVHNNVFCARFYCVLLTTCFNPDRWPSSSKMYTKYILGWPLCMSTDPLSQLYIVAYGGFKESISGYTRNRMQNPTIKLNISILIIGFCILLRIIWTVNNNTFCFATIDKVFY
jgi:hypothetical protein